MSTVRLGSKQVENFKNPYVIAEIGANHNGDMALARKLMLSAKQAGCDCAKFQSWTKNSLFSRKAYEGNPELEQMIDAYSLSKEDLKELSRYSEEIKIDFACSAFSQEEADFLIEELKVPFLKVASMDLNNYPFLDYLAQKNVTLVVSTGLASVDEIEMAMKTIKKAGNDQIVLLHCVALYPPSDDQINLNNIDMLRSRYPQHPIGFSDHSLGTAIALAAIAKGACLIEKHYTLDKNMPGWDHAISITSGEMAVVVRESKRIVAALGNYERTVTEIEKEKSKIFRRSIVTVRAIPLGKRIEISDLDFKRPGSGLEPRLIETVLGRTAKRAISADELLNAEDF